MQFWAVIASGAQPTFLAWLSFRPIAACAVRSLQGAPDLVSTNPGS